MRSEKRRAASERRADAIDRTIGFWICPDPQMSRAGGSSSARSPLPQPARPGGLIGFSASGHYTRVTIDSLSRDSAEPLEARSRPKAVDAKTKDLVRQLIDAHYAFVWRLLARWGVKADEVDDATQQVFMVPMTRERLEIQAGRERAYLFGIAVRVAQEYRRRAKKRGVHSEADFETFVDPGLDLESLTDQQRARRILDKIVMSMPEDLRMVFILFELEGLSAPEVASLVGIPAGTVASRLRRGRQIFRQCVQQLNIPGELRGLR